MCPLEALSSDNFEENQGYILILADFMQYNKPYEARQTAKASKRTSFQDATAPRQKRGIPQVTRSGKAGWPVSFRIHAEEVTQGIAMTNKLTVSRAELWKADLNFDALALPLSFEDRERCHNYFRAAFLCRLAGHLSSEQAKIIEGAILRGTAIPPGIQGINIRTELDDFIFEQAEIRGAPFIFCCRDFVDRIGEWSMDGKYGDHKMERLCKALKNCTLFRRGKKQGLITPDYKLLRDRALRECKPLLKMARDRIARTRRRVRTEEVWKFIKDEVEKHPDNFVALAEPNLTHLGDFLRAKGEFITGIESTAKFVDGWIGFCKGIPREQVRKRIWATE